MSYLRLRLNTVEFKLCSHEACVAADKIRYEGDHCPGCGTSFNPTKHRRASVDLLVALTNPSSYERLPRWRCSNPSCKNLYEYHLNPCPLCQQTRAPGARPTYIWVRTFFRSVEIDDGDTSQQRGELSSSSIGEWAEENDIAFKDL